MSSLVVASKEFLECAESKYIKWDSQLKIYFFALPRRAWFLGDYESFGDSLL